MSYPQFPPGPPYPQGPHGPADATARHPAGGAGRPYAPTNAYPVVPPHAYPQPYGQVPPLPGPPYGGPQGPRNGFGITALVVGVIAVLLGLLPLLDIAAFVAFLVILLGFLALVFGGLGIGRARSGRATNTAVAVIGTVLGLVGLVMGLVGLGAVVRAVDDLADGLRDTARPSASAPVPTFSPPSPLSPGGSGANTQAGPAPGGFTWEDGLAVEVSAPRAVTFSDTACCPPSPEGVAFTVRLINGTSETVAPFTLLTSLTVDGVPAEQVFDVDADFDALTASVPPGGEFVVDIAFDSVGSDLLLEFSGIGYQPALFAATL